MTVWAFTAGVPEEDLMRKFEQLLKMGHFGWVIVPILGLEGLEVAVDQPPVEFS